MQTAALTYTQLKAIIAAKSLVYQYIEDALSYTIFAIEGSLSWETRVLKDAGADVTDFETNFKTGANAKLYLPMKADGPVAPGTAATNSQLTGGVYNSTPPTLTNTQQAALQMDSAGRLLATSRTQDGTGNALTSSTLGAKQALDVSNVDGLQALTLAGKHFSCVVEVNLPTTAETPFFYFKNPNGSGKNIYLTKLLLDTTVKGAIISARMYANPTSSANGTAATAFNLDIKTSPTAAVATPFTNPTVSANGTKLGFYSVGINSNTPEYRLDFGVLVEPNNNILFTGIGDANNRVAVVTLEWVEV